MVETKMVHFSLGENAGVLLMQIAQEHLIYNSNPQKAIDTIEKSLIGIQRSLVLEILHGKKVLIVDGDEMICADYDPEIHSKVFPHLDCPDFSKKKITEINKTATELAGAIKRARFNMKRGKLSVDFTYQQVMDYIKGDEREIIEEFENQQEVQDLALLVRVVKSFLDQANKDLAVVHFMKLTWPEDFDEDYEDESFNLRGSLMAVTEEFSSLMKASVPYFKSDEEDSVVDRFIKASTEISKTLEKGIESVDIMDNYSAGWLSPEGVYYALNGEIANMLHNQIATALYEKGSIPKSEENESNPDAWLMAEGWVRIHGNQIDFEAHTNERFSRGENKFMTDVQLKMITDYCRLHHGQIVKLFFQPVSALTFLAMATNNRVGFYQKYFNF